MPDDVTDELPAPEAYQFYLPGVPAEPAPEPVAYDAELDHVPDGTVADVLAWVGDDPDRAQLALDAEHERTGPDRVTLIGQLETLAAGD